jgi:lipopolysaccharide/colanic/teichoic acid biosynthesis glycosyltransferase
LRAGIQVKRAIDIVFSLLGLVLLSPLLIVLLLIVLADLGSPVLFKQQRPGFHGRPFLLAKFRTMRTAFDQDGVPLSDEQRLTKIGSFLRRWSLDELPELWNVLVGEMSLVGPRPLLMEYLPLYNERQAKRHLMKPGLTGLAQVSGRNDLTWEEKFELDVHYVEHWSLGLDIVILAKTVAQVLSANGISAEGHATMPPFRGTKSRGLSQ